MVAEAAQEPSWEGGRRVSCAHNSGRTTRTFRATTAPTARYNMHGEPAAVRVLRVLVSMPWSRRGGGRQRRQIAEQCVARRAVPMLLGTVAVDLGTIL